MGSAANNQDTCVFRHLPDDCLTELFSRCRTQDLVTLRQTCRLFLSFIDNTPAIWERRIADEFGFKMSFAPTVSPVDRFRLLRTFYDREISTDKRPLRFQAALVNGGIDATDEELLEGDQPIPDMVYWADNLFNTQDTPYCSDCPSNADCLALLLDDEISCSDSQHMELRKYLEARCRYAAALLEQVDDPANAMETPEELLDIVERWSEQRLEHFFISLFDGLVNNHPMGRLLLYDVPHGQLEVEVSRLRTARDELFERALRKVEDMLEINQESKSLLDTSVASNIIHNTGRPHIVSMIERIELSRSGSLTCPVSSGVVIAGIIDYSQLHGLNGEQIGQKLYEATQDPIVTFFNDRATYNFDDPTVHSPTAPRFQYIYECEAGYAHLFNTNIPPHSDSDSDSIGNSNTTSDADDSRDKKLVEWRPLAWFKFHTFDEAVSFNAVSKAVSYRKKTDAFNDPFRSLKIAEYVEKTDGDLEELAAVKKRALEWTQQAMDKIPFSGGKFSSTLLRGLECRRGADGKYMYPPPHQGPPRVPSVPPCTDIIAELRRIWMEYRMLYVYMRHCMNPPAVEERITADLKEIEDIYVDLEILLFIVEAYDTEWAPGSGRRPEYGIREEGGDGNMSSAFENETDEEDDDEDEEDEDDMDEDRHPRFSRKRTRHRNLLSFDVEPCPANIILVKLIDQENLMDEMGDEHDWPNIDMRRVKINGKRVALPVGVHAVSYAQRME